MVWFSSHIIFRKTITYHRDYTSALEGRHLLFTLYKLSESEVPLLYLQQKDVWPKTRGNSFFLRWPHFMRTYSLGILWWRYNQSFICNLTASWRFGVELILPLTSCLMQCHSRLGHECYRDACQQVFLSQSYYLSIGNFRYCHWETSPKCVEAHFISILLQMRLYLGRFLWKGEKPLYYSAIDKPVVYKRRGEWGFFSLTPSNSWAIEKLSVLNWKVNT